MSAISGEMFHGTLPRHTFGDTSQINTGFLLGLLNNQTLNHLIPWLRAEEYAYQARFRSELMQYERLSRTDAKAFQAMWGRDDKDQHFFLKLLPKQVSGFYDVDVDCELSTYQDKLSSAQLAEILVRLGIYSKTGAAEDIIKLPDSAREQRRRLAELVQEMPEVMTALAIEELIAQERYNAAMALGRSIGKPVAVGNGQIVNPNTGLPERGLPNPEVMSPPMAQGSVNPEAVAAAGRTPAGRPPVGDIEALMRQMGGA